MAIREGDKEALARLQPLLKAARSGLNQLPPHSGVVIQTASRSLSQAEAAKFIKGEEYTIPQFWSSSKGGGLKQCSGMTSMRIQSVSGKDISLISRSPGEGEVLFAPGTKFMVNDVKRFGQVTMLQMEETATAWK
jgi:hypothetical protein